MNAQTLCDNTKARLRRHEGQYAELARRTPGLSYSWVTKFAHGQADNPTVENLQRLIDALDAFEKPTEEEPADPDAGRIAPAETTA